MRRSMGLTRDSKAPFCVSIAEYYNTLCRALTHSRGMYNAHARKLFIIFSSATYIF